MRCANHFILSIIMGLLIALCANLVWGAPALMQEVPSHFDAFQTEEDWLNNAKDLADIRDLAIKHVFGPDTDPSALAPPSDLQRVWITNGHPSIPVAMTRFLFEGDILLSRPQMDQIKQTLIRKLNRFKRNAGFATRFRRFVENTLVNEIIRVKRKLYANEYARWNEFPIKYVISATFDDKTKRRIRDQIDFYEKHTCLTFQEYSSLNTGDYLEFFRGSGCYSMIGYVGGRQGISIGSGCERSGVIQHEIGHALGFWHEQSRPDADSYIKINSDSIIRSMISNFLKRTWSEVVTHNVPYDVGSVMHYGPTAFTKDWNKFTIETLDKDQQRTIGQREHLSFHDLHLINLAYCADKCSYSIACQHNGYQNPVNCNECLCPNGLGGARCDRVEDPINAQCGGELTAETEYQDFTSPGYPYGYEVDQKCVWLIKAPHGRKVHFEFIDRFQFFCTTTCLDYVEVKTDSDLRNTGSRFCCFTAPDHAFESGAPPVRSTTTPTSTSTSTTSTTTTPSTRKPTDSSEATETSTTSPAVSMTMTSTMTTNDARNASTMPIAEEERATTPPPRITTLATPKPGEVDGQWTAWGSWTPCSKTCGGCGVTTRIRNCVDPPCEGNSQEFKSCGFDLCPADTVCTKLNFYDKPCGPFGVQVCSNVVEFNFKCNLPSCCPPFAVSGGKCALRPHDANTWSAWSDWGECLGPKCGGCAVKARHRVCKGDNCEGESTDYMRCNTAMCTNCADDALFFPEFFTTCLENQDEQSCKMHRRKLIDRTYTCPCCKPLVERNGECSMPPTFMH